MNRKEYSNTPANLAESLAEQDQLQMQRRKGHLQEIVTILTEEFGRLAPESSAKYYIRYHPVQKRFSGKPDPELEKLGRPLSAAENPDYYSFVLVPRTDTRREAEILQLPPTGADRKAAIIKDTIAFGLLKSRIQEAITALVNHRTLKRIRYLPG